MGSWPAQQQCPLSSTFSRSTSINKHKQQSSPISETACEVDWATRPTKMGLTTENPFQCGPTKHKYPWSRMSFRLFIPPAARSLLLLALSARLLLRSIVVTRVLSRGLVRKTTVAALMERKHRPIPLFSPKKQMPSFRTFNYHMEINLTHAPATHFHRKTHLAKIRRKGSTTNEHMHIRDVWVDN